VAKVTHEKWEIRKNNRRFSQAAWDSVSAVRARRAAGAPPGLLIDEGHCARIDRFALLAQRSLFDK